MRLARPRSLNGLMLSGFALVALPLLFAVVRAAINMDQLARESEQLVVQGVEATRYTQRLIEEITSMKRNAQLYQVLGDADLLGPYRDKHGRFVDNLVALGNVLPADASRERLVGMREDSLVIFDALQRRAPDSPELAAALRAFDSLSETAAAIAAGSRQFIDRGLGTLQREAREAQESLAWQTAALIPGTIALVLFFTLLLARPIRQIDRAISELGKGTFSHSIHVSGPRDIEALGRQLEWLRVRLLELAQEKNRFLRQMSHDLKTPLATIREGTELLMDGSVGELGPGQREVAGILHENGLRLQQLIENLLSFSAWQAQDEHLQVSEFGLRPLVDAVLAQHSLTLDSRQIRVRRKLQEVTIKGDRGKIRMVLDNLISNASKFTPEGGAIYVALAGEKDQAIIDVADTGPGIPETERSRIFEAFYKSRTPQSGRVPGSGIGLSVVLECVNAHGGTVEILDGTFRGAHFRLRLPRQRKVVAHA